MLRTKPSRLAGAAMSALMIAFLLAACTSGNGGAKPNGSTSAGSSGALIVNTSYPPSTIDPSEGLNQGDFIIPTATYVTLVQYAPKSGPYGTTQVDYTKFDPYLAKSWTVSQDQKTYTFYLNKNFRFSDGTPITAADVKFSFERDLTMNGGGAYYLNNGQYKPPLFQSIDVPSPYTIVFHLSVPLSGLLSNWAQPAAAVLEPSVVNAHGGVKANTVNKWVAGHIAGGGGPYVLTSYNPGVQAVLQANPKYPLPVKSQKIIINFITNPATLGVDARDGEADITIGAPPSIAHSLQGSSLVNVASYAAPEAEYLGFNTSKAPGNNQDLRLALNYATPFPSILQKAEFGFGTLFSGPIIPSMVGYNSSLSQPHQFNLAKARQLIAQSGLKTPINLTVDVEAGDQAGAVIGPIIKDYWSQVGVNITLQTLSAPVYVSTTETGKDQAYIRTAGPGVPTPGYYLGYAMICGISFNLTRMCVPQLDTLLKEGIAAPPSQQQQYWDQITTTWRSFSPRVQFFGEKFPIILKKTVHNYEFSDESSMQQNWGL